MNAPDMRASAVHNRLLWFQGFYYLPTGLWPIVDIESFQSVTGRKTDHLVTGLEADHWLVMTVSVLICSIALAILVAAWRREISPEVITLAVLSSISLAAIDLIYVSRGTIARIYLADAGVELVIIVLWVVVIRKMMMHPRKEPLSMR